MITYLKKGISAVAQHEADAKVLATVEHMLRDVAANGAQAVRHYSEKFDHWAPESFNLSEVQIQEIIKGLPKHVIAGIEFAQTQTRNFTKAQKDALREIEVETIPGVILGHKNIPVNPVGCYVSPGAIRWVASAHIILKA